MAENNQIKISMRASDNEVQDQIDRLNAKLEETKAKLRDVGKESRSSTREAKQGFDDFGEGVGAVEGLLGKLAGAAAFTAIAAKVREMVTASLAEIKRLEDANREGTTGLLSTLGMTGDTASFASIQTQLRNVESTIGTEAGRQDVFRATRDAAPSLPVDQSLEIARLALGSVGDLTGGNVAATSSFAAGAARLARSGFNPSEALDISAFVQSAQGGQQGLQVGMNLAEVAAGSATGEERRTITEQSLALALSAAQAGLPTEFVSSSLSSFGGYRRRKTTELAKQFEAQGMSKSEALKAAAAQIGNVPLADSFFQIVGSGNEALMQEAFGEGGVRMRAVSPETYSSNIAAVRSASGYVGGQLSTLPPSARSEIEALRESAQSEMMDIAKSEEAARRGRILQQRADAIRQRTDPGSLGRGLSSLAEWAVVGGANAAMNLGVPGLEQAGEAITAGVFTDNSGQRVRTRLGPNVDFGGTGDGSAIVAGGRGQQPIVVSPVISITQSPDGQIVDYSANLDSVDTR